MKKQQKKEPINKPLGTAKGKATFDQNGDGNSSKYAQAGTEIPNENGALADQEFNKEKANKT